MTTRPAIVALLIGFLFAAFCQASAASPLTPDEAVYAARFNAMMAGKDVYDRFEPIAGARSARLLPVAQTPTVTPAALEAAKAYAAANKSSVLLVWRDGALHGADYFGGATARTPLLSKSLAKPLTAIVIGRAIKLGYIKSLDQPVSDFITEWKGTPKAAVTIRYLLDMRSGFLGQAISPDPENILNRAYLHPRHGEILINDYPLTHTPGTRFDYANAVADMVAIVIERATHQRYAQFVSDEVLAPLGAQGGSVWVDREGGLAHAACCMLLPAESWLRLAILLIDDGRIGGRQLLPPGYVDEMKQPTAQNPYYGLGVYVAGPYTPRRGFGNPDTPGPRVLHGEPYLAKDLFLFDGNADQVAYIVPSQRLIVLRMGDQPPKTPEWDNAVLPNLILRGLMQPASGVGPQPITR
jgi:CubicO group peptidase (beta-lactamase class C family)